MADLYADVAIHRYRDVLHYFVGFLSRVRKTNVLLKCGGWLFVFLIHFSHSIPLPSAALFFSFSFSSLLLSILFYYSFLFIPTILFSQTSNNTGLVVGLVAANATVSFLCTTDANLCLQRPPARVGPSTRIVFQISQGTPVEGREE